MLKRIKSKVRRLILKSTGKVDHIKIDVKCKNKWYGNIYGGFYVSTQFLGPNSIIYSFGIGEDISFDKAIIKNHNCNVFGFDPTPKSIMWIKNQDLPANFNFYDFGIGNKSGFVDFYLPKNPEYISGSYIIQNNVNSLEKIVVKMKSFEDIINELGHKHIDILKMDIEGAEYDVIDSILNTKIPINQFLIEFHDRLFENGKVQTQEVIGKLKSNGYGIFAISDSFEEISFIKYDLQ
jgi:FkbM family methyltransferase